MSVERVKWSFFFLHGDSRQGKVASEAATVGLFCL